MEPFKNFLGFGAAEKIATALHRSHKDFSSKSFLKGLERELEPLELKQRMLLLSKRIADQLDASPQSFPILVRSLKNSDKDNIGISGFLVWPLTEFVAEHGLNDFKSSLEALKEMTKVFTAEFAVRPFFLKDESQMLKTFGEWANDSNEHVRRLVSEGSRPLLPWGQKLPRFLEDPQRTWPLLEALQHDPSKYVQKSVANHMNDLSKLHGDWLVKKLQRWPNPWVARHAVRSLVKKGHKGALELLGVDNEVPDIKSLKLASNRLRVGETLKGSVTLMNPTSKPLKIIVDVELYLLRLNGSHSIKVFKGKKVELGAGATQKFELSTPLKKVSTRKYYPGTQYWSLIVNGHRTPKKKFHLSTPQHSQD